MKKIIAVLLMAAIALTVSGCGKEEGGSSSRISSTASEGGVTEQTYTFQINPDTPHLTAAVFQNENGQTTRIVITDTSSGAHIQTVVPPDNKTFTKSALYFMDITFSGNLAMLVPLERVSSYITFAAYLWDAKTNQLVEEPSFSDIRNPSIDSENKRILSNTSANQVTSYSMYSFEDNEFRLTNSVYWQPAYLENGNSSNSDGLLHLIENNNTSVVNDIFTESGDGCSISAENPKVSSYFSPGSFWDLNNQKWHSAFYDEIK